MPEKSRDKQIKHKKRDKSAKCYKKVKHRMANRMLEKLDRLITAENLVQLNFSDALIKAVEVQKIRQIQAAAGATQCYETFPGDPYFYIYDVDPSSGTMTPAKPSYQSTKPTCPACRRA